MKCEYQQNCALYERHQSECPKYAEVCSIAQEERKKHTKTLDKKIDENDARIVELEEYITLYRQQFDEGIERLNKTFKEFEWTLRRNLE